MLQETELLKDLNPEQQQAVNAPPGHQLIIAGAGSGKTRVLVHRIAWLTHIWNIPTHAILAVTFTNKAAQSIRTRAEGLAASRLHGLWLGTFHSICHRLLRQFHSQFKIHEQFQVIDQDDQLRLIKKTQQLLNIDEKIYPAKKTQHFINHMKDQAMRAGNAQSEHHDDPLVQVYSAYENTCRESNIVDFSELLLRTVEEIKQNSSLRSQLQNIFRFILIDEFQDTNQLQYQLIKLLAGSSNHVTVVGDDDQSIYSWRGAQVENIRAFSQDFQPAQTTRLEQNYRSTQHILTAANQLIAHNNNRLGKNLWTEHQHGEKIELYAARNEIQEAEYIVEHIRQGQNQQISYGENAVLYRSNAQSRVIEEQLARSGIPYVIYGGLRFFERVEIKDSLAYLRLLINPDDNQAFERIINIPSRRIGPASLEKLRQTSIQSQQSLWQSAQQHAQSGSNPTRYQLALQSFLGIFESLRSDIENYPLSELLEKIIQSANLIHHIEKQYPENAKNKLENIQELILALQQFEQNMSDLPTSKQAAHFIADITLDNRNPRNKQEDADSCVQLMTLHTAKGLEFKQVFLTGLEEGLFPHKMALQDGRDLEEERRLCYVGMTRAMSKLHLSYAECRRLYQQDSYQRRSRFIDELPKEQIQQSHNPYDPLQQDAPDNQSSWNLGSNVRHPRFGEGVILNIEGSGAQCRIQVRFHQAGVKWLLAEYAKLEPCHH